MATNDVNFVPASQSAKLERNMVLRIPSGDAAEFWRITHVFRNIAYVMRVSTPEAARSAKRPQSRSVKTLESMLRDGKAAIGKLKLPSEFTRHGGGSSEEAKENMAAIEPLVTSLENEANLSRWRFTQLIQERADEIEVPFVTLRRLLLRFYYFGRLKSALTKLAPGPEPGTKPKTSAQTLGKSTSEANPPRRRGRQSVEAKTLGRNDFIVSDVDIEEMLGVLRARAEKSITTVAASYDEYLKTKFAKRYPTLYKEYLASKRPVPVTLRQFRSYYKQHADFEDATAENIRTYRHHNSTGRGLTSAGPGEMYEIDATGGRIFLVDGKSGEVLGTPIIYLVVDRWSRYVVSVYITLRPASWEEIRFALLIAFTSRERRFKNLGLNVDDKRWPPGRVCAMLVSDRGSEMISEAMLFAAAEGLNIEPVVMPPFTPDGKAIVERLIRTLKQRMAQRGIKGTYALRPLDPQSKRAARRASQAAVRSLRQIYWDIVEIILEYNERSHSSLEKLSILKRHQVEPTPKAAYLWGLQNLTGIRSPPLTDEDYQRLLLAVDKATLGGGYVMYRNRKYLPVNPSAMRRSKASTSRRKGVTIKVDRSDPVDIFEPTTGQEWPHWRINSAGLQDLRETTIEEEDALKESDNLLTALSRNKSLIARLQSGQNKAKPVAGSTQATSASKTAARRSSETQDLKRRMTAATPSDTRRTAASSASTAAAKTPSKRPSTAEQLEEAERLATVRAMQARRKR